jgi:hypothetical protein
LQVASHIVPWAEDRRNRLNPHNGLCLSAPHDRAFDQGLITITPGSLRVRVSERLRDTVRRVRAKGQVLSFANPSRSPAACSRSTSQTARSAAHS